MKPSDYGLPDDAAGYVCYQEGDEWCCHDTLVDAVDEYVSECLFVNKINDTGCRDCEVYLASVRKNPDPEDPDGLDEYITHHRVPCVIVLRAEVRGPVEVLEEDNEGGEG